MLAFNLHFVNWWAAYNKTG